MWFEPPSVAEIVIFFITIGLITIGPVVIVGVVGGVTGRLTQGASVGKGTLIGMGVGLLTLAVCWLWIGVFLFLPDILSTVPRDTVEFWRELSLVAGIPLSYLAGAAVTVFLVRRTRN